MEGLTVDRVKRAIDQLPDGYRTVLTLYLIEGYDHQEIAEIVGCPVGTVRSRIHRGRSELRIILARKLGPEWALQTATDEDSND